MKPSFIFLCLLALAFVTCKKEASPTETNEPVENNPELTSTKDISLATVMVSDIMQSNLLACDENANFGNFMQFLHINGTISGTTGTMTAIRDSANAISMMSFIDTKCRDGKIRSGTIFFKFGYDGTANPNPDPQARISRVPGFTSVINFIDFKVDNWKISTAPGTIAVLKNIVSDKNYNPSTTKLAWSLNGKFIFTNSDSTRNITWEGTIIKTLKNTSFVANSKTSPINWSQAVFEYTGTINGFTSRNVPYTFTLTSDAPVTRDMNCSVSNTAIPGAYEYHPLVFGSPTLKTANLALRYINYSTANSTTYPCDNKARVVVTNQPYEIDLDY